jgi:hypothetical protein
MVGIAVNRQLFSLYTPLLSDEFCRCPVSKTRKTGALIAILSSQLRRYAQNQFGIFCNLELKARIILSR